MVQNLSPSAATSVAIHFLRNIFARVGGHQVSEGLQEQLSYLELSFQSFQLFGAVCLSWLPVNASFPRPSAHRFGR